FVVRKHLLQGYEKFFLIEEADNTVFAKWITDEKITIIVIIVYQTTYRRIEILFITLALLKISFFSLFLTFLVKGFSRVVLFSLALFNFQDAVPLNSRQATYSLYHTSFGLSSTFFNFSRKFSANLLSEVQNQFSLQNSLFFLVSPSDSFIIISCFSEFVK
ncbi:MAG: hypothetical protein J6I55_05565, partial [Ruminococcus sp.]|nr:hypothetical protein [Ruminococcus sp.]